MKTSLLMRFVKHMKRYWVQRTKNCFSSWAFMQDRQPQHGPEDASVLAARRVRSREENRPARLSSAAAGSSHPPVSAPSGWRAPRSTTRPAQHLSTAAACFHCPPPTCYLAGARKKGTRGREKSPLPVLLDGGGDAHHPRRASGAAAAPLQLFVAWSRRRRRGLHLHVQGACFGAAPSRSRLLDGEVLRCGARHPAGYMPGGQGGPPATEERGGGHYLWRDWTLRRFGTLPSQGLWSGLGSRTKVR